MSEESKDDRAVAMIAALQTILDNLPQATEETQALAEPSGEDLQPVSDPTHQLFMERLNQQSLAGLFASIRIIHYLHKGPPTAPE